MRPVISIFLVLVSVFPLSAADALPGVIRVMATYPGADARTFDETVVIPIFQQINGVDGMSWIESDARNDGTGTLTIYFYPRTDMKLAEVMVQNRVNLALPTLPEPCRQLGISVRKVPAGPPMFWLALTSADKKHDAQFLINQVLVLLKSEFTYTPGVTDVRIVGTGEFALRVAVNPQKLAAYNLSSSDVIEALRRQNTLVTAGGILGGKSVQHRVTASGRLTKPSQFEDVILRANPNGELLRVRDIARIEMGAPVDGLSRVNGKPAALVAVTAWPGRVTAEQLMKTDNAGDLPPGVSLDVVADRTTDRFLAVEVRLPESATLERTEEVVARATELIRALPGKPATFAHGEGREPNLAMIFVKVDGKGRPTVADVEKALDGMAGAAVRVGAVAPGEEAFPVRIALTDPSEFRNPAEQGEDPFREEADRVVAKLIKDKAVSVPAAFPGQMPRFVIDIDREMCAAKGVEVNDLLTTLQVALGGVNATDFHLYGRTYRVEVQADSRYARNADDLKWLKVRSGRGDLVALDALIKIRKSFGPAAVVRVNGYRAIVITAAPGSGKTPAEAAARCVKLAQEVLPRGYRVKDLTGPSQ